MEPRTIMNSVLKNGYALGDMLVRSVTNDFITAFDYFEPEDARVYKSSFGDTAEIIDSSCKGFYIGSNLTLSDSFRNIIVFGNTGSGKGVNIIVPSILTMSGASLLINDLSGENYLKTSGYYTSLGYRVGLINFGSPETSDCYNPLDYIQEESHINKLAALLVRTALGSNNSDPFWSIQATNILRIFISIVLKCEPEHRNLANVLYLLNAFRSSPKSVDRIFIRLASDKLLNEYRFYVAMDSKLLSSIISTAQASLQLFSSPDIAAITAQSTISLSEIRKKKTIIYIQANPADSGYYKTLVSLFFEQVMQVLLARLPDEKDLDTFLILDEANSLANLSTLPLALTNLRKYRCGILTAWQSKEMITHHYGSFDAQTIIDNSLVKVYLSGQGLQVAKELEAILGRTEVKDKDSRIMVKPLMLSEEIRQIKSNQGIVLHSNKKPFLITFIPYFQQGFMKQKANMKPAERNVNQLSKIHYIPLV